MIPLFILPLKIKAPNSARGFKVHFFFIYCLACPRKLLRKCRTYRLGVWSLGDGCKLDESADLGLLRIYVLFYWPLVFSFFLLSEIW